MVLLLFRFLGVLPLAYSRGPTLTFTQNTSKDAVPRKDVPFGGFKVKFDV